MRLQRVATQHYASATARGFRLLEIRVLGPIEATVDGAPIDIGGPKPRLLLSRLAADGGRVVSVDALVDTLWPDDPPATAHRTVQAYVSRLRGVLGADAIESVSPGYRLHAEGLDLARFERLVEEATRLAEIDPTAARSAANDALTLWRGDPFSGIPDPGTLQPEIVRLVELRLAALEARIAAELHLGRDGMVIGDIEALLEDHPWRESLWLKLMTALARSGRQAEALRAYQRARRILGDEMGIEPSPELRDLEDRILMQDHEVLSSASQPEAVRGYELLEEAGPAPTGTTYRARQGSTGREVALTVVGAAWADDPAFIRSFETGTRILAGVEHPHCAPVLDAWREPGAAFLVRPWFTGGSLADTTDIDVDGTLDVLSAVGEALDAAHRQGTVHGAVSDATVWLDGDRNPYLVDFDLTEVAAAARPGADRVSGAQRDVSAFAALAADRLSVALTPQATAVATLDEARSALGRTRDTTPTAMVERNPYKGLRPFDEADAGDFFGRAAAVDGLARRLAVSRFLAVVGPSGSGKSSLVRAGLLPALRNGAVAGSDEWLITTMTPGSRPFEALAGSLLKIADTPPADFEGALRVGLGSAVEAALPVGVEALIVIDQFEELFTLTPPDARADFARLIRDAVTAADSTVRIVTTLRADAYDGPLEDESLAGLVSDATVVVVPMTATELTDAIRGPASGVGVDVEPALLARLLNDVADEPAGLPLLQFALTEVFDQRESEVLSLSAYEAIGGLAGAVARSAEAGYSSLAPEAQRSAEELFLNLITVSDDGSVERRRALVDERASGSTGDTALIEEFGRRRLLAFDRDAESRERTVELSHESLATRWDRLARWIDDARDDLVLHRRTSAQAADWENSGRDDAYLLTGSRLDIAEAWLEESRVTIEDLTHEFVGASLSAAALRREAEEARRAAEARLERRAKQRLRVLVGVFAVAALIAGLLSSFALSQRAEADRQAVRAEEEATRAQAEADRAEQLAEETRLAADETQARGLVTSANALANSDPELGLILALEAAQIEGEPGAATLSALHRLLMSPQPVARITTERLIPGRSWIDISHDGELIAIGAFPIAAVEVRSVTTGEIVADIGADEHVLGTQTGRFLTDGSLAVIDRLGELLVYRLDGTPPVRFEPKPGGGFRRFAEVGDGSLVAFGNDRTATRWSKDGRLLETINASLVTRSTIQAMLPIGDGSRGIGPVPGSDLLTVFGVASGESTEDLVVRRGQPRAVLTDEVELGIIFDAREAGTEAFVHLDGSGRPTAVVEGETAAHLGHDAEVSALSFSPAGSVVFSGDVAGELRAWDAVTGATLFAVTAHPTGVQGIRAASDRRVVTVGTGSEGLELIVWDLETSQPRHARAIQTGVDVWTSVLGPGSDRVGMYGFDVRDPDEPVETFGVWELADGTASEAQPLWTAAPSRQGAVWVSEDLSVWRSSTDGSLEQLPALREALEDALFSPGNDEVQRVYHSPNEDLVLIAWCCRRRTTADETGQGLSLSTQFALIDAEGRLTQEPSTRVFGTPLWYAWAPNGERIAYFTDRSELVVHRIDAAAPAVGPRDVITGAPGIPSAQAGFAVRFNDLPFAAGAFHPIEPLLAIGDSQGVVDIWDISLADTQNCDTLDIESVFQQCGTPVRALVGRHTAPVLGVAFTADGRRLVSGDTAGKLVVWSVETGEAELEIPIYGGIRGIHPTDDPNRVLAVTESGTIHTITLDPAEVVSIATSRIGREPTAGECEFYGLRSCG